MKGWWTEYKAGKDVGGRPCCLRKRQLVAYSTAVRCILGIFGSTKRKICHDEARLAQVSRWKTFECLPDNIRLCGNISGISQILTFRRHLTNGEDLSFSDLKVGNDSWMRWYFLKPISIHQSLWRFFTLHMFVITYKEKKKFFFNNIKSRYFHNLQCFCMNSSLHSLLCRHSCSRLLTWMRLEADINLWFLKILLVLPVLS